MMPMERFVAIVFAVPIIFYIGKFYVGSVCFVWRLGCKMVPGRQSDPYMPASLPAEIDRYRG